MEFDEYRENYDEQEQTTYSDVVRVDLVGRGV